MSLDVTQFEYNLGSFNIFSKFIAKSYNQNCIVWVQRKGSIYVDKL